jgi:hypothetical protein
MDLVRSRSLRRMLLTGVGLMVTQQFSGECSVHPFEFSVSVSVSVCLCVSLPLPLSTRVGKQKRGRDPGLYGYGSEPLAATLAATHAADGRGAAVLRYVIVGVVGLL